ncbi:tRNA 2-thiouridine(34) synthase MnmA [Rubellicoccus peritrichatus]|uniref:tRNA-specific 2-thiouridylase MnmA n=1 Tax=Rubellicoccus peritrichatus TaxID=3080537 RepID=A0AAQ3LDA8_9BACT|nr:tRNA 2-thiouridine(34) synthase MnmA [Puniceicoccus sp. CR14]WOO39934.1 tRNA 2-thiouridine(34) synthase MnmA [Puniceicoccus sp. CR14]
MTKANSQTKSKGRVLVALSGGVDSAVAALLLKEQGYDVSAAYMRTWMNEEGGAVLEDCPWEEDIRNAKAVCLKLGIPFEVVNLIDDYREKVVHYLVEGYRRGITPNPDIMCNREMKFGVFRDFAKSNGFDFIATGHYVRKGERNGRACIREGLDGNKDQSYFLAMVRQEQIADALFPIGEMEKPKVRELAHKFELPNASRKDSQGICFLGKVKIGEFLENYIEDSPGPIMRSDGKVLGEHRGLHRYTIGQRKGLGVPSNTDFKNYVVVAKNYENQSLIVAFDEPNAPGLYECNFEVHSLSWISDAPIDGERILARPRYRDPSLDVIFELNENETARIRFSEPQRALTSGQVVAFYLGDVLLGGGYYL